MSLPTSLQMLRMTDATVGDQIDNKVSDLERAICDIFGIPIDTQISAAALEIVAAGLNSMIMQDAAADPALAGYLRRNATRLKFHDGTAARNLAFHNFDALNFATLLYTADVSTTFTTYQTFAGLSLPLTTNGGTVLVAYTGPGSGVGDNGHFTISQDLVDGAVMAFVTAGNVNIPVSIITAFAPAAGAHSYTLRGKAGNGTGALFQNAASAARGFMVAVELRA